MNKQDRQGVRTPAQLEEKYNFGKSFAEIMGIATDAQTAAENAGNAAAQNEVRFKSEVIRLDNEIRMTVSSTNEAKESANKANGAAAEAKQEAISLYSELLQKAEGIEISVSEVRKDVNKKAEREDLKEITEHFRFASDGMTISNTATGMGIRVSEQQVEFLGAGDPTTVIRPNDMHSKNLSVEERLDLGGFSFIPRSNNNLSLRWTGGNT